MMNRRSFMKLLVAGSASAAVAGSMPFSRSKGPRNIILILADDLGWGDVSCYGPTPDLTPTVDRLAKQGMRFVDAHAPASTCTPTRFSVLTGEYAWRKPGRGILPGDAGLIIPTNINTLPKLMSKAGCVTGAVGKWHLGMGKGGKDTNWNEYVSPGPKEIGFDYSFVMPATGDRVPCVYMENQRVVNLDPADPIAVSYQKNFPGETDGVKSRDKLKMDWSHGHNQAVINGIGRIGYMTGGKAALWDDETMADTLAGKAVEFITANKDKPFFLYFAPHDIHVPRCPHPRFKGKTTMGPRGDAILQFDYQVQAVVEALDKLGIAEDTLLVITSDNGPYVDDGYRDQAVQKMGSHKPAADWRGTKYTPYEGGHRVPFVVRWPGHTPAGVTSDALISLIDLPTSFAALKGVALQPADLPDSLDMSRALVDPSDMGRDWMICQDWQLNLREGQWKYVVPRPAGNNPQEGKNDPLNGELYELTCDPSETMNIIKQDPDRAKAMFKRLTEAIRAGRTRPTTPAI